MEGAQNNWQQVLAATKFPGCQRVRPFHMFESVCIWVCPQPVLPTCKLGSSHHAQCGHGRSNRAFDAFDASREGAAPMPTPRARASSPAFWPRPARCSLTRSSKSLAVMAAPGRPCWMGSSCRLAGDSGFGDLPSKGVYES